MKSKLGAALFYMPLMGAILALAVSSSAKATTYDSLDAWKAAVGAYSETREYVDNLTDPVPIPNFQLLDGPTVSGTLVAYPVSTWGSWCCNYEGQVLALLSGNTYTGVLSSPVSALGMFIEPGSIPGPGEDPFSLKITLTLPDGSSISDDVFGTGPAQFFGWTGAGVTSFTVSVSDPDSNGLAIGDIFAVSAVPGPIAGRGLPAVILAGAGLIGWWCRKRTASSRLISAKRRYLRAPA